MGTKQGYAITTWRLRLRCKHPEWLETTQNFYNEIQKFYYDLYLERPELWNENSQNALRGLETLSIPGRTRKQVEYPVDTPVRPKPFIRRSPTIKECTGN